MGILGRADGSAVRSLGVVCADVRITGTRATGYAVSRTESSTVTRYPGGGAVPGTDFRYTCGPRLGVTTLAGGFEGWFDASQVQSFAVFCNTARVELF